MSETTINAIIEGGKASAGPPLGPALGPMGINIGQLIDDLNKQTSVFAGIKVPVKVIVNKEEKKWRFEIGTPATGEMIKKELGIEKGRKGGEGEDAPVGNLEFKQVIKVAKATSSLAKEIKSQVSEVLGTCVSLGVTVDNKDPREIRKSLMAGEFDSLLAGN
ncbi:MAG: 50S ribosomal protein L11 [Candidatus Micrarchaeota archaeon]